MSNFLLLLQYCIFALKINRKIKEMKRIATLLLAMIALALFLNACKSSEHCPAYGQVDQPATSQHA
jgi:hypothetical protein